MTSGWRIAGASVKGTSHDKTGEPCQDSNAWKICPTAGGEVLVVAVSDGAGSAAHSQEGSAIACRSFIQAAEDHLGSGLPPEDFDREAALRWATGFQRAISASIQESDRTLRDYACTFLGAIIGGTAATFVQVGDGAIVASSQGEKDDFAWVFWPQNGEYANTTYFLTEERVSETLMHEAGERAVGEVALFTDGVQTLALQLQARIVHLPFFTAVFGPLRGGAHAPDKLNSGLEQFLSSPSVNSRTDDDKTLVLASRLAVPATETEVDAATV